MHLFKDELADKFVALNPYIIINNMKLNVHKLRNNAKRITISEVPPYINNISLIDQLKRHNIEVLSPLILLKSNMKDPEFAHVYSFRRQTLLKHTQDNNEIPDTLLIEYEGEYHRIYLSNFDIRCGECHNKGHTTEKCKKKTDEIAAVMKPIPETTTDKERSTTSKEIISTPNTNENGKRLASNTPNTGTSSGNESEKDAETYKATNSHKLKYSS